MFRSARAAFTLSITATILVIGAGVPASAAAEAPESYFTIESVTAPPPGTLVGQSIEGNAPRTPTPEGWPKRSYPEETPAQLNERADLSKKFRELREDKGLARAAGPGSAVDCQDVDSAEGASGLVIDHFTWCQYGSYVISHKECVNGQCSITARVGFQLTLLGNGKSGSREASFVGYLDNFRIIGVQDDVLALPLTFDMSCEVLKGSKCVADSLNKQTHTVQQWIDVPNMFFNFSSPETGSTGSDMLSWYDFTGIASLKSDSTSTGHNAFRCDSAAYMSVKQGCVFDQTEELWYDLSVADPAVNETAQHVLDAQERPDITFPQWTGKSVPGSISSLAPLSRIYHDKKLRDNNRAQAVRTCKQFFGADYASRGLDCDEYPFSSTAQGAASGDNRYSARALDSGDNQAAGRLLGQFYDKQRVLDSDPFFAIVRQ